MIVKVEKLDHNGKGIAKINNKITFIENALPEEIVDIIITKEKKNYNEGKVIKIISKNINRVEPLCPYYNECGGCDLMHMNYSYQLELKKENIKNILKKYAGLEISPEITASNKIFNYRNKITLHKSNNKLGYMEKSSNKIVEIKSCLLAIESINNYIKEIKEEPKDKLIIRTNNNGEIISTLKDKPLIININEFNFYIDINSFFQINNYICSKIFDYISEKIDNSDYCLDLYSGVGTLSILASKKALEVFSIEINKYSHQNAIKNLKLNNIKNVNFLLGPVEEKIKEINKPIDLIIIDPPRNGIDNNSLKIIKEMKAKKIIYMSCNPMTLARDLNSLKEIYDLSELRIFDMFPNTKHVECVCVLCLR